MKKLFAAMLLSTFCSAPAWAARGPAGNIGANISLDGVIGIQGEFNLEAAVRQPLSVQFFWKDWSAYDPSWNVSAFGAAGIYDFSNLARLGRRVHPYAGAGLIAVHNNWRGTGVPGNPPFGTELYLVGGGRYDLAPQLDLDMNLNTFGGLTLGVDLLF